MLPVNRFFMSVSTAAALQVPYHREHPTPKQTLNPNDQVLYRHVSPPLSCLSLALNFANRHHEVQNAALVLAAAHAQKHFSSWGLGPWI